MQLRIIGRNSPFPAPGSACLGYLLEHQGDHVLLDCGSGVLSKLGHWLPLEKLAHVVLSHLHGDHCSDLFVLRYAADARLRWGWNDQPVRVYAPAEPAGEYDRLAYRDAIVSESITPGGTLDLGSFRFEFYPVAHALPGVAMRITAGGRTLAYSGDSGPCDGLVEAARQADLFLCEATLRDQDRPGSRLGHLSGGEAGQLAEAAGSRRLLLTHFFPAFDPDERGAEARRHFSGPVEVVREGENYQV